MAKCQTCDGECWDFYAFQPFGPDQQPHKNMTEPGSHYRGFPVIKICPECHDRIRRGASAEFTYKKVRYITASGDTFPVPEYVSDVLAWFEDNYQALKKAVRDE